MSCGLYVVAFAWGTITSDTTVFDQTKSGNLRKFICERIADRGELLVKLMKVTHILNFFLHIRDISHSTEGEVRNRGGQEMDFN